MPRVVGDLQVQRGPLVRLHHHQRPMPETRTRAVHAGVQQLVVAGRAGAHPDVIQARFIGQTNLPFDLETAFSFIVHHCHMTHAGARLQFHIYAQACDRGAATLVKLLQVQRAARFKHYTQGLRLGQSRAMVDAHNFRAPLSGWNDDLHNFGAHAASGRNAS